MTPLDHATFAELCAEAERQWAAFKTRRGASFHPFVPADFAAARRALTTLKPRADTFLELGSGVGLITVVADLLGYRATGIELDPWLVESSWSLAERFTSDATFACGTFVPRHYDNPTLESSEFLTVTDGPDAYDELGVDLDDFDLIYAFPWPDEEELVLDMVRRCAAPQALFLRFHGTDGFVLHEHAGRGEPVPLP